MSGEQTNQDCGCGETIVIDMQKGSVAQQSEKTLGVKSLIKAKLSGQVNDTLQQMRFGLCQGCKEVDTRGDHLFREIKGISYCGKPRMQKVYRDELQDGCGCDLKNKTVFEASVCPHGRWGPGSQFAPGIIPYVFEVNDSDRVLKGVVDFLLPSSSKTLDMTGIGDAISMGPVAQAMHRHYAKTGWKVRFCAPSHRVDWCKFSGHGVEVDDLGNPNRMFGEIRQHSTEMQFLELDETARTSKLNRHGYWARRFTLDYNEMMNNYHWEIDPKEVKGLEGLDTIAKAKAKRQPVIIIAPHANSNARAWSMHNWAEVCWRLQALGAGVILIGSRKEDILGIPGLKYTFPNPHQTAHLFTQADLILGNDSGMVHMAGFVTTPAIAVCGPTDGNIVFGGYKSVEIIQGPGECTGCLWFKSNGYTPWCNHGCKVIERVTAMNVIDKAAVVLARRGLHFPNA